MSYRGLENVMCLMAFTVVLLTAFGPEGRGTENLLRTITLLLVAILMRVRKGLGE